MILVALLTGLATAAGVFAEGRLGARAEGWSERLLELLLWVLVPVVTFVNMVHLHLNEQVGAGVAFGGLAVALTLLVAWRVGRGLLHLPDPSVGALMVAAAFGNTGFLGLPFVTALFGGGELANAIVYDLVLTSVGVVTVGFSVGAAFGNRAPAGATERARAILLRNPPLWAAAAGAIAPAALSPEWAVRATHELVYVLPVIGFFVVGVTLSAEAEEDRLGFPPPFTRPVAAALVMKLVLLPGVVLALSALLIDIPRPYPVQAAMASAINTLLIAHKFGLDRALIASVVAWSTALVVAAGLAVSLL